MRGLAQETSLCSGEANSRHSERSEESQIDSSACGLRMTRIARSAQGNKRAQSIMEYCLILTTILFLLLSTNFIGRIRGVLGSYFNKAVAVLASG